MSDFENVPTPIAPVRDYDCRMCFGEGVVRAFVLKLEGYLVMCHGLMLRMSQYMRIAVK
jgi:hypothetical protein